MRSTQKPQGKAEAHSGAYLLSSIELWFEHALKIWLWALLLPGPLFLHKTSADQKCVGKPSLPLLLPLPLECLT